ncbi:putative hydrolase of the HAD superfamily [Paramicrobacterium humi]|uniref:Putative hydrolase of the HAD superfamily n=1 Tax=Paramicrobacterium humi TaxID=640635 RepID=A0A1H4IUB4_9MICO|nr:HAD family hydrolase [Microbacterium humi]SEB37597.1 putative hydrolase of the HAD superfamily [Microbacterium humi]
MIRLALFDLDDTLLDHRGAVIRGIHAHVGALGAPYGVGEVDVAALWHELEDAHYHRYLSGELSFAEQRRTRALEFAAAHGIVLDPDAADAWYDDYFQHYRDSWELFDDALACLDAVEQAGARIGVITNGEAGYQQVKLAQTGLEHRFAHVIASGTVGVAKPDPRIFQVACEAYGVSPAEALYVGDRLITDAAGAASAGLTGVWLNRFGEELPEGAIGHGHDSDADAAAIAREHGVTTITSLAELPALIGR